MYECYQSQTVDSDSTLGKRQLILKVKDRLGEQIVEMKVEGCSSLWCMHSHLASKLVTREETDAMDIHLKKVTECVMQEAKELPKQDNYNLRNFL